MSYSGSVYHALYNPPRVRWFDDIDGTALYQREDDKAETVRRRIEVYIQQTSPLIEHYRDLGLLVEIDGTQDIDKVTRDILDAVHKASAA
jgi:adenylate kinase